MQFGGEGESYVYDIAPDNQGNVFAAGETRTRLDGTLVGPYDAFVSKFDANGEILWSRQVGSDQYDDAAGVAADALGNVVIAGKVGYDLFEHTGQAYISKYDADGNQLWYHEFGSADSEVVEGLSMDALGNVFVGGVTFGDWGGPNAGQYDAFLSKFNSEGTLVWTQKFGSSGADEVGGVTIDERGNVWIAGSTRGVLGESSHGGWDGWLALVQDPITLGDTNGDGLVDLADLNNVRNHFGSMGLGDTNADGIVDLEDLNNVRNHFGESAGASPVPEPSTASLMWLGLLAVGAGFLVRRFDFRKSDKSGEAIAVWAISIAVHFWFSRFSEAV